MNVDIKTLPLFLNIADRAFMADVHRRSVRDHADALREAYNAWKAERGIDHVERDSFNWREMMTATTAEYLALEEAKRLERNARKQLQTAIDRIRRASIPPADFQISNEQTAA